MSKSGLILEMAAAIWRQVLAGVGRPPKAIVETAGELAELYELANNEPLLEVAARLSRSGRGIDVGVGLVRLALGDAPDSYVDAAARADISVPTFDIMVDSDGDEMDVTWEGSAEPRGGLHPNPREKRNTGSDGPVVFLLEDEPALQKATTRMIKKILPGAQVVVSDNVDGMIGNLKYLEPKLIVSDFDVVGNKSGGDFFRYIKQHRPDLVDRFVFFTGNADAQDEGHYRFVSKPATVKDLQEAILSPAPTATIGSRQHPGTRPGPLPAMRQPSPAEVAAIVREVIPAIHSVTDADGKWSQRFGDEKVFVSAIWDRLQNDPRMGGMSLDGFKRALLAAHRDQILTLSRADLVGAMNYGDVSRSEISDMNATFHFVMDPALAYRRQPVRAPAPRQQAASVAHTPVTVDSLVPAILGSIRNVRRARGPSGKTAGRYGLDQVFISAAYYALGRRDLSLDEFKRLLLEANRRELINLVRADLVDDMDPEEVQLSEINDGFGSFHFILDPSAVPLDEREYLVKVAGRERWMTGTPDELRDEGSLVLDNFGSPVYRRRR